MEFLKVSLVTFCLSLCSGVAYLPALSWVVNSSFYHDHTCPCVPVVRRGEEFIGKHRPVGKSAASIVKSLGEPTARRSLDRSEHLKCDEIWTYSRLDSGANSEYVVFLKFKEGICSQADALSYIFH